MAMTADSPSNHVTQHGSGLSGDGLSSPQLRRKNFPSPWSQVVRGEPEPAAVDHSQSSPSPSPSPSPPQTIYSTEQTDSVSPTKAAPFTASSSTLHDNPLVSESSDANNCNADRPKKPAWNKLLNGVVEVGPVMGAVSWPALSESTKPWTKSLSLESSSSKILADGSVSSTQVPVIPHLPQKVSNANANPNSNPNRTMPARLRSKRGSGGVSSTGGLPTQSRPTQPPPPFPVFPIPPNSFGNLVTAMQDPSPRVPLYRGSNWDTQRVGGFVPQSHHVNDQRNSSRKGNYGQRRDGNYHNSFGDRHDQDSGNYSNARNPRVHPQRGPPRGFVRPPPPDAAAFVSPQLMRPFPNYMGFPEFVYIPPVPVVAGALRGMTGMPPFIPPSPMLIPVPEPSVAAMLIHQIDYYFSDANLVKDEFLKSNMDGHGWVSITLIASFPRVKSLTNNIQLILDTLRTSTVVEVQEDKVRRRNEWMKWIVTPRPVPTESGLSSPGGSSVDVLATSFQKITVEEGAANQRSLMSNANIHSMDAAPGVHSSEGEVKIQTRTDQSKPPRMLSTILPR